MERRGDPLARRPRRRGARASRAPRASPTRRRARWPPPAAGSACISRVRAERPRAGLRALPLQARVAGGAARRGRRRRRTTTIVCGDMNIAPTDADVFDPDAYVGQTHVTAPEREALAELQALGLHDVVRERWPDERVFTYWDYRAGMFHQDLGMRIDLVLASDAGGRAGAGRVGRPPGPQGQRAERPRAGDRRPRRGAGRRHRAGRAAAVRPAARGAAPRSCRRRRSRGRGDATGPIAVARGLDALGARPASSDSRAGRACRRGPPRRRARTARAAAATVARCCRSRRGGHRPQRNARVLWPR